MIPIKSLQHKLLSLPQADWKQPHTYKSLLLLPSPKLHDSGWKTIIIIGVVEGDKHGLAKEKVVYCDDIRLVNQDPLRIGNPPRMDMTPYNVIHLWSRYMRFKIPACQCSSCDVIMVERGEDK
jgi:hypothetical protein